MEANNSIELNNNKPQWNKVMEANTTRKKLIKGGHVMKRRRVVMKRRLCKARVSGEGLRVIESRVRTLKSLINPNKEPEDLEGLFRVTADYILGLQMRVRLMQMMVDSLTPSPHDHKWRP